ncbi:MAG: hypothetical protein V3V91_06250 [Thermoplasmata archaeon]
MSLRYEFDSGGFEKRTGIDAGFDQDLGNWFENISSEWFYSRHGMERGCRALILRVLLHPASKEVVRVPAPKCDLGGEEGRRAFWESFLGEPIKEPHKGAVKEFENRWTKLLPKGTEIDIEEITDSTDEE